MSGDRGPQVKLALLYEKGCEDREQRLCQVCFAITTSRAPNGCVVSTSLLGFVIPADETRPSKRIRIKEL